MNKKKKGSSLITVLAVSILCMLLGGLILQAINMTMKSNINQKKVEDLRYSAESGLEVARSYFDEKLIADKNISEGRFADYELIINERAKLLKDAHTQSITVKLSAINENGILKKINITSKAVDINNKEETISCIYKIIKNSNNNIYDYGIISGQEDLTIDVGGALGINNVLASAGDKILINGTEQTGPNFKQNMFADFKFTKTEKSKKITVTKLDTLKYPKSKYPNLYKNDIGLDDHGVLKFYDMDKLEQLNVTEVNAKIKNGVVEECSLNGKVFTENIKENVNKENKESIVKINVNVQNDGVAARFDTKIWIFNTNELDMDLKGESLHASYSVILGSDQVNVTGSGTLTLDFSTLYGKALKVDKDTTVTMSSPSGDDGHGIAPNSENNIDEILNLFIDNWHQTDGLDTINAKLENKSFEK